MNLKSTRITACLIFLFISLGLYSQQLKPIEIANEHVRASFENWGLAPSDVEDRKLNDFYTDVKTGISRVFYLQQFEGIPVHQAIMTVNISKEGEVFFVANDFVANLAAKINTTSPITSAEKAVNKLAAHLDLPFETLRLKEEKDGQEFTFEKGNIAQQDIRAKLCFQTKDNGVRLAWDIYLAPVSSTDTWSSRIDALTGEILSEHNWTSYCRLSSHTFDHYRQECKGHKNEFQNHTNSANLLADASYNVWPSPIESPNHGPRTTVEDPANAIASPFGWHDIDGVNGAEYTITRGNNIHAFQDRNSIGSSAGDEPDGGPSLVFDFPWNADDEPEDIIDAAVVNLFYWTNFMHDFSYRFGFDEVAGNYQQNNYGNGGADGDYIIARAQAGAANGQNNNAFFVQESDGQSSTIAMFVWKDVGTQFLTVNAPSSVSGLYGTILPAPGEWAIGAYVTSTPVTAEAIYVNDGTDTPTKGCEDLINAAEIAGKIALVDRGVCDFSTKALRAQEAGAIGVVICNIEGASTPNQGILGPGMDGGLVNIPTVFLSLEDCVTISEFVGNGLNITLVDPGTDIPEQIDGDLDNGIVAHEYAHGITSRLSGGPGTVCLNNIEAPSEGWSDWFSLVTTVQPGDTGEMPRGIGSFALRQTTNSSGERRFPFSTEMDINPLTYKDVASSPEDHDVGEVWTTMIWGLYWAFVDQYGWSADLYDENSGNYKAIQLVFEGLKNQGCSPGFVTARDAIREADNALFNGENQCLIWKTFARRGLGLSAEQGSPNSAGDQTEAFDIPCECRDKVSIAKTVTDFIEAGDVIDVAINISNCKMGPVTNVIVTDEIPDGTEFVPGSANVNPTVQGSTLTFELGDISFGEDRIVLYKLKSSADNYSEWYFKDEVIDANADENWDVDVTIGSSIWEITDLFGAHTGTYAWYAENIAFENEQFLILNPDAAYKVIGNKPALRFYHKYNTQNSFDGGLVEVKPVGASMWEQVDAKFFRNGYDLVLPFETIGVPNLGIFNGSNGTLFEASYVDLSDWLGQTIQIRFRFATNETFGVFNGGWFVDDIEFMNLFNYNTEVCLSTDEGINECHLPEEEGTIVESMEGYVSTVEQLQNLTVATYPNPVDNVLNVEINSEIKMNLHLELLSLDGKTIHHQRLNILGNRNVRLNVSSIPAGMYFLKISSDEGFMVKKVGVQ